MNSLVLAAATAAPKVAPVITVTTAPQIPAATMPLSAVQQHAGWLTHGLAGLGIIAALAMILLLALQTTKQEGLSGTIGGRVESTYRGRPGAEEQLKRLTGVVVGVWLVCFLVLSLTGI